MGSFIGSISVVSDAIMPGIQKGMESTKTSRKNFSDTIVVDGSLVKVICVLSLKFILHFNYLPVFHCNNSMCPVCKTLVVGHN